MHRIRELFDEFRGDDRVVLMSARADKRRGLRSGSGVDWCDDVAVALKELIGPESIDINEREEFRQPAVQRLTA